MSTITVSLSDKLIHACVYRIMEASGGKIPESVLCYMLLQLQLSKETTFMAPNLYKHGMQRRTGNHTLKYMVKYIIKKKKNIPGLLLAGGKINPEEEIKSVSFI